MVQNHVTKRPGLLAKTKLAQRESSPFSVFSTMPSSLPKISCFRRFVCGELDSERGTWFSPRSSCTLRSDIFFSHWRLKRIPEAFKEKQEYCFNMPLTSWTVQRENSQILWTRSTVIGPHVNFELFFASSVASLDELCIKNEQKRNLQI